MLGSSNDLWPFFEVKKPEEATSVEVDQEAEKPTSEAKSEEPETATKSEESGETAVGATAMDLGNLAT